MAEMKWTKAQADAIWARGGAMLVSAAAGSGKTAVLAQRVAELIADEKEPVDADRLLVATFSNAAAAEMRERIADKLSDKLEAEPDDARLARQQLLLERAGIGTVHSFCLELVRANFHELDLPPDFRIAEERELSIWREDSVNAVIEEGYRQGDADFIALSGLLSTGRDDRRLAWGINRLYDFMRARTFYEDWLNDAARLYNKGDIGASVWGEAIFGHALAGVEHARALSKEAVRAASLDERMAGAYMGALLSDISQLEAARESILARDWDGAYGALRGFAFARLGALRGYADDAAKEYVKALRDEVKKITSELSQRAFSATREQCAQDIAYIGGMAGALFSLALRLDEEFTRIKRARGAVDFSDLEQLAIRLLTAREDGRVVPSRAALELQKRYEHIFVDEYQDTNEAQELIFGMVSRGGDNLFMVGDVKQSIYRFRQAMPEIFLRKRESFAPYDGGAHPSRIILGDNFRSRREVTDFINYVFSSLMSRELGEVDYGPDERLIASAAYPDSQNAGVEVHIVEAPGAAGEEKIQLEARHAAAVIADILKSGAQVSDGGVMRPVSPGDICILLRSPSGRAAAYGKALSELGIGARTDSQSGLLAAPEVRAVLALLRCVDNPLLDVELAACLLSPIFAFTPDELARIRLADRSKSLYVCAGLRAAQGDTRCADFMNTLASMRAQAAVLPADRLIRRVYELTGFLHMAGAMENGDARRANLRLLAEYAGSFESGAGRGLPGFLSYIERIERRGDDLPCAFSAQGSRESVSIMSVHRSKGLEFPVVLLCDTARRFNRDDLRGNMLIDPKLGFTCARRDDALLSQYTTAPLEAARIGAQRAMLSEELRVLYVAMTRAKERLIVTSLVSDPARRLLSLARKAGGEDGISPFAARGADSLADWILMSLLRHPDGISLRKLAGIPENLYNADESKVKIVLAKPSESEPEGIKDMPRLAKPDQALVSAIRERARWEYPYEAETRLPSKLSVTDIVKPPSEVEPFSSRPNFISGTGLDAAQRGTAAHQFLRWADFAAAARDPAPELERLVRGLFLTPEQADAVDMDALRKFFASELASRIMRSKNVRREYGFITELGADKLGSRMPELGGGKIAVQGVADLVFEEDGRLFIVDYKTDRVRSARELKERYRPQLELYADILSAHMGLEVGGAIIYSLHLNREIRL